MDTRTLYDNNDRVKLGGVTNADKTECTVLYPGFFTKVCEFDADAFTLLLQLVQREEPGMEWTQDSLLEYLKFTWLRLVEQHRVVWVKGATSFQLKPFGLTQYFFIFHSGLFIRKHFKLQPLYLVATQVYNQRLFCITANGLHIGQQKPAVQLVLKPLPDMVVKGSLMRATYFSVGDSLLLFNHLLPFLYNAHHILVDRKFRVMSYLQEQNVVSTKLNTNELLGLVDGWILESIFFCGRSFFGCAVPQMHYKLANGEYVGCRQLLLPLFCGTPQAILALPVEFISSYEPCHTDRLVVGEGDGEKMLNGYPITRCGATCLPAGQACYKAHTAIPLKWARMNARLVDVPQAQWLLKK